MKNDTTTPVPTIAGSEHAPSPLGSAHSPKGSAFILSSAHQPKKPDADEEPPAAKDEEKPGDEPETFTLGSVYTPGLGSKWGSVYTPDSNPKWGSSRKPRK